MTDIDSDRSVIESLSYNELGKAIQTHRTLSHEIESPSWNRHLAELLDARIRMQGEAMREQQIASQANPWRRA